jgi:hypothetical protein
MQVSYFPDYLRKNRGAEHWKYLATAMLTGESSLKQVYFRDGLQKQAHEEVNARA